MIIGLPEDAFPAAMFGVTPAVLSTAGALIATTSIKNRFSNADWQRLWLEFFTTGHCP